MTSPRVLLLCCDVFAGVETCRVVNLSVCVLWYGYVTSSDVNPAEFSGSFDSGSLNTAISSWVCERECECECEREFGCGCKCGWGCYCDCGCGYEDDNLVMTLFMHGLLL